jgi:hypothetical protein
MKTHLRSALGGALAIAATLAIASGLHAQQVRDSGSPAAPPRVGTGIISGAVTTDEPTPQPVRRAAVSIVNTDGSVARTTFTDTTGRFTLSTLPEGRYTLSATKAPFLRANYGAKRFDLPGTPITLKDGGRMTDVALRLQRGGVLSGRITDENGEPAFGVGVRAMQVRTQFGEKTFVPANASGQNVDTTDDHGAYRLFRPGARRVCRHRHAAIDGRRDPRDDRGRNPPDHAGAAATTAATAGGQPRRAIGVGRRPTAATKRHPRSARRVGSGQGHGRLHTRVSTRARRSPRPRPLSLLEPARSAPVSTSRFGWCGPHG